MEPMRVVFAGFVVVVRPPAPLGRPWSGPGEHDLVLHQVSAWLSGLRQGVQAAPPLPTFPLAPAAPRPEPAPSEQPEPPLPGFYL
jgi:hypothetical protein